MILKIAKHKWGGATIILAGDIGATKSSLAICSWNGSTLSTIKTDTYKSQSFSDINSMIGEFISNKKMPEKICLGVAGPVKNGIVSMTNIGLEIKCDEISKRFDGIPAELINDLEATANGLAVIDESNIHLLHAGEKEANGNVAIICNGHYLI